MTDTDACRYSARHQADGVPATTTVPMGPVGDVPCCAACAALYVRLSGGEG